MQKKTLLIASMLMLGAVGVGAAFAVAGQSLTTPMVSIQCGDPAAGGHCGTAGGPGPVTETPDSEKAQGGCGWRHHWW